MKGWWSRNSIKNLKKEKGLKSLNYLLVWTYKPYRHKRHTNIQGYSSKWLMELHQPQLFLVLETIFWHLPHPLFPPRTLFLPFCCCLWGFFYLWDCSQPLLPPAALSPSFSPTSSSWVAAAFSSCCSTLAAARCHPLLLWDSWAFLGACLFLYVDAWPVKHPTF